VNPGVASSEWLGQVIHEKARQEVLKTAKISGMDEQEELLGFLGRYMETILSTTGVLGFSQGSDIPSLRVPEMPKQREVWRKTALANDARAIKE
jgi:hypothetical protein